MEENSVLSNIQLMLGSIAFRIILVLPQHGSEHETDAPNLVSGRVDLHGVG